MPILPHRGVWATAAVGRILVSDTTVTLRCRIQESDLRYCGNIERKIRDEYLLDKSGAGWYKIRNALKKAAPQTDFAPFETTYAALAAKLEPLVYEYGFLKE